MNDRPGAIASIEHTLEVSASLRWRLVAHERVGRTMVKALRRGDPVSMAVGSTGATASELRSTTTDPPAEYEAARHEMRTALLLPYPGEGRSIGGVGREFGTSHRLACRLARDARHALSPVER